MLGVARVAGKDIPWVTLVAAVLLTASFLLPATLMRKKSATFDEVAHLPAGYSYLKTGLFKINPHHPPLLKQICALPLLFLDPELPMDRETLLRSQIPPDYQWEFGKRFLYTQDADRLLFWGRVPAVLLSTGLAFLVFLWAGKLWGSGAGLVALYLYVFDPTLTAHAQLVATDVGLAFFATLFLYLLWRYQAEAGWARLVVCGVALGLALGTKFSSVVLLPVTALLLGLAAWFGREQAGSEVRPPGRANLADPFRGGNRAARLRATGAAMGLLLGISAMVLWVIYLFPSDPLFYLKDLWLVNLDHNPDHLFYLMGELKQEGWRSYLLIAWLIKTPIPSLLLLALSVVFYVRGRTGLWLDEAFLAVPALAFFVGYSLWADNLGVRYLLPCFPFFFIFTARLVPRLLQAGRGFKVALAVLLVWCGVEFVAIWPDHLSYFNQLAGGPSRGSEWLDDSNIDWGQGLIQLREYLEEHPVEEYRFCYFGSGDPSYYGITGQPVSMTDLLSPAGPGTWILSAHCVARAQARLQQRHGVGPGNWLKHVAPVERVGHAYYVYELK